MCQEEVAINSFQGDEKQQGEDDRQRRDWNDSVNRGEDPWALKAKNWNMGKKAEVITYRTVKRCVLLR